MPKLTLKEKRVPKRTLIPPYKPGEMKKVGGLLPDWSLVQSKGCRKGGRALASKIAALKKPFLI